MVSTEEKIVSFLSKFPDHATTKRNILMRIRYRHDFKQAYEQMLQRHVIEEFGAGVRTSPRMVWLKTSPATPASPAISTTEVTR